MLDSSDDVQFYTKPIQVPIKNGLEEISEILVVFKKLESVYSVFWKGLKGIHTNFEINSSNENLSITKSLNKFKYHLLRHCEQVYGFICHLNIDIIEPLTLFSENISNALSEITTETQQLYSEVLNSQKILKKSKDKYFKDSELYEKFERTPKNESNTEDLVDKLNIYQDIIAEDIQMCFAFEEDCNQIYERFENTLPNLITHSKFNEESRVYFIKTISEKYMNYFLSLQTDLTENCNEVLSEISKINPKNDVELIYSDISIKKPEKFKFETFQNMKENKNTADVNDLEVINSVLDLIIFKKQRKHADLSRLKKILQGASGKFSFLEALYSRKSQSRLNCSDLERLSNIITEILLDLEFDEDSNTAFLKIIDLSEVFFCENSGNHKFLWKFLAESQCFNNDSRWLSAIEMAITRSFFSHQELLKKKERKSKSMSILTSVSKLTKKIILKTKNEVLNFEKKLATDILFDFVLKMWKFCVDFRIAKNVILTFSLKYEVDPENVQSILAILQPPLNRSLKRVPKTLNNIPEDVLVLALPYLTISEAYSLLFLSKKISSVIYNLFYCKLLMEKPPNSISARKKVWQKILEPYYPDYDFYDKIKNDIKKIEGSITEVIYIIDMDIKRSYQDDQNCQNSLRNVLQIYAFTNPNVNYCQGMNFIAGTFFFITQTEKNTYNSLYALIRKAKMEEMFGSSMKEVKRMFYKLNKLIEVILPQIYNLMVTRNILAESFTSSWFLTIFSSCLDQKLMVLIQIWDHFLVKGWKIVFKVAIYLLKFREVEILKGGYEENLKILGGNNLFNGTVFDGDFMSQVNKIKITNSMLNQLDKDYELILFDSNLKKDR